MSELIAVFIRHGDYQQLPGTPSAHQPFPLTDMGIKQARKAAALVREMAEQNHWQINSEIHCSNLLRAWQTADIIGQQLDGRFSLSGYDALAERSMGSAANLTLMQIEDVLVADPRFKPPSANWKSDSHYRLPLQGAESLLEAGERIAGHVRKQMEILQNKGSARLMQLFVGHGAAFRHAAHHLGVLEFEQIAKLSMYHATPVAMSVLPGQAWQHVAGNWKVRPVIDHEID